MPFSLSLASLDIEARSFRLKFYYGRRRLYEDDEGFDQPLDKPRGNDCVDADYAADDDQFEELVESISVEGDEGRPLHALDRAMAEFVVWQWDSRVAEASASNIQAGSSGMFPWEVGFAAVWLSLADLTSWLFPFPSVHKPVGVSFRQLCINVLTQKLRPSTCESGS